MNNVSLTQVFKGEWLEYIPTDWKQSKIKHLFSIKKNIAGELGHDVISITQRGAKLKDTESGEGQLSMDYSKYQLVTEGDFLMNHMDLLTGYVDISKFNGVTSPDYRVFTVSNENAYSKYFLYLFQHGYKSKTFYAYGRGSSQLGRWRFPTVEFEGFYFPIPPIEEQKLISRYLDKKTSQIDSLVENIQKKIELLKEQRTSLINNYVTKGLDPNVEMKDSGVEWIGEIPKHWEFTRNKNFLKLSKNIVGENWIKHTLLSLGRSGVTVRDLESGKGKFPESFETYQTVKVGQFVFCLFDIDETPRTVGLSNEDGMITGAYTVFDCSNDVYAEFIYYYYLTIDEFKGLAPHYSGLRKTIRPSKFLSLGMFLPSLQEQMEIVEHINIITKKIDKSIDLETNRKLVLNEYKQSLISSVVTGKIRVTEDMI